MYNITAVFMHVHMYMQCALLCAFDTCVHHVILYGTVDAKATHPLLKCVGNFCSACIMDKCEIMTCLHSAHTLTVARPCGFDIGLHHVISGTQE